MEKNMEITIALLLASLPPSAREELNAATAGAENAPKYFRSGFEGVGFRV